MEQRIYSVVGHIVVSGKIILRVKKFPGIDAPGRYDKARVAAVKKPAQRQQNRCGMQSRRVHYRSWPRQSGGKRSEEHTSELQSLRHLVCRLLLVKKKTIRQDRTDILRNFTHSRGSSGHFCG